MSGIRIYTKNFCGYCQRAKGLLSSLKIPWKEIPVESARDEHQKLAAKHKWHTVPMIFAGDRFLGGFDDVNALHRRGELLPLLAAEGITVPAADSR